MRNFSIDRLVSHPDTNDMNIIRKFRKQRGLTQEQLGEMVGVKKALVSKWEHGLKPAPLCAVRLHDATSGELPKWEIRPDLWEAPSLSEPQESPA